MTARTLPAALLAAAVGLGGVAAAPPASAVTAPAAASTRCLDEAIGLTFEENFLTRPEPARFVAGGGFDQLLQRFRQHICDAADVRAARRIVENTSRRLWKLAVARVQGKVDMGTLSAGDDRPLYWTRLAMTAHLRQWAPWYGVSAVDREGLIADVDRISRGQEDIVFRRGSTAKRVLVTGFDPFTLWRDVRQANPSGASALALDGIRVKTRNGTVEFQAALFPVRWRDFSDGMVERALVRHLAQGRNQVDMWVTTSQGRVGRIDLEHYNGAWRAGFNDNENVCYRGVAPVALGLPTVRPQPQWTVSTLPITAMVKAGTGPFPVYDNTTVVEVPGSTPAEPVTTTCPAPPSPGTTRPLGPTPGSQARAGGGGNYLSNEIAYRATLLRDALGVRLPGGHLHTPVLTGLSASDPSELTNVTFEGNRTAINGQVRALILAAARNVR